VRRAGDGAFPEESVRLYLACLNAGTCDSPTKKEVAAAHSRRARRLLPLVGDGQALSVQYLGLSPRMQCTLTRPPAPLPPPKKRRNSTLGGPSLLPLTHAAAAATLTAGLRRLCGESFPPHAWSLVGVDPGACVAVYRVDAR
jgi:hypothetical protein